MQMQFNLKFIVGVEVVGSTGRDKIELKENNAHESKLNASAMAKHIAPVNRSRTHGINEVHASGGLTNMPILSLQSNLHFFNPPLQEKVSKGWSMYPLLLPFVASTEK
jgi:hypothetical protein